ncbi:hypothetical protein [Paramesorhizobium deserti]|uniref:hypothetical protein n=1 Tax=Paramesorhizobium deserti TaxID=1494590 RepID=UPI0012904939|nr:hypothetical protein [Paramesorhizobium deserti]
MRRIIVSAWAGLAVLMVTLSTAHAQTHEAKIYWQNDTRDPYDVTLVASSHKCVINPGPSKFTVDERKTYSIPVVITDECYEWGEVTLTWDYSQKRSRFSGIFFNSYLKARIYYDETYGEVGGSDISKQTARFAKSNVRITITPSETPDQGDDKREWFRAKCSTTQESCLNNFVPTVGHVGRIIVPTVSGEIISVVPANGGIYGR